MEGHERNKKRRTRVQRSLYEISFFMEFIAAVFVIILILCQMIGLGAEMFGDFGNLIKPESISHYLEICLDIVICVEFLKMLCRHNMDAVIEVLIFTLTRHLIVVHGTAIENIISVAAIAVLFAVRKYLFVPHVSEREEED